MVDKKAEALKIIEDKVEVLPSFSRAEHEEWFDGNIHQYKTLAAVVAATLKSTLDGHGIGYVDIPYREKEKKSFLKKIDDKKKKKKKDYSPCDMTDLAGIRVITLIESDVKKVGELIHSLFNVHPEDSINKSASLGEDKVGYRSVHFVCDIGETREGLLEWKALKGLCFEIQVRTALEHAWAEIEHDRGYKLGGKLPSHLSRRFSLLSGLLESADLEFNRLTVEIEDYAKTVKNDIEHNADFELSTISVQTLLDHLITNLNVKRTLDNELLESIIDTTIDYGIENINELKRVISNTIPLLPAKFSTDSDDVDIILISLMVEDLELFFEKFNDNIYLELSVINNEAVEILKKKYNINTINKVLKKYDCKVE